MIRNIFLAISITALLVSCGKGKEVLNVPVLRASSIYNVDSVVDYKTANLDFHIDISNTYFNKGLKLKESNPKKAIYNFKRAITLYPNYDAYKELAALLLKQGQFEEATYAYGMIVTKSYYNVDGERKEEYIFQTPEESDYYEYLVSIIISQNFLDAYVIYLAREAHMDVAAFKAKLIEDDRIKLDKKGETFNNILLNFMTDEELEAFRNSEVVYKEFLASIKDSSRQFEINEKKVQDFIYHTGDGDFEDGNRYMPNLYVYFLKEKQEHPDNWYDYNFNRKIKINESITAVIYSIDTSAIACPKDMRHISYRLATYNSDGKIVDSKIVAMQSGDLLSTLKFNTNQFTIAEFKRHWKKAYDKNDFDNDLVSTELVSEKLYQINSEGKIVESVEKINVTNNTSVATDSTI